MKNRQFNTVPHRRGDLRKILALLICGALGAIMMVEPALGGGKMIVGWLEKVQVSPGNLLIRAKLDTGAKTCSLTALNIVEFMRNGEPWVRFDVVDKSRQRTTLEQKVHRVTRIKRHGGEPQKRVVIRLSVCLGSLLKEAEVTLVDRTEFNYPMLLGRSFLAGSFVVDPSAKFTTKYRCLEAIHP